jgi:hypothetical protein
MYSIIFAQGLVTANPNKISDFNVLFANILKAAIPGAGIVLFLVLLFAGFNYASAGEDMKKAESARNMATYAIYGIVLVALSYLILRIIALFTGVDSILNFQVCVGPC